jgi:hypothetical protein
MADCYGHRNWPVWAASRNGNLYVVTAKSTGKARRLRATGRVRFAPSGMSGRRILGDWLKAQGESLRMSSAAAKPWRPYGASTGGSCPWRC